MKITLQRLIDDAYVKGSPAQKALTALATTGIDTSATSGREQMRVAIQALRSNELAETAQRVSGVAVR